MSTPSQIPVMPWVPWVLWALLSVVGAHRLYLGVAGWWYWPVAVVVGVGALLLGLAALAALIKIGLLVLWVYDAAHITGWSAARAERAAS
ncbi:MAG: hypothetical protein ACYCWA_00310 [Thiobacillus sp.]